MSIVEQQEQDQKRREQEQKKREQKLRERASKRARRSTRARPTEAVRKPSQEHKEAGEEPPAKPPLVFLSKQQVLARIPITGPTLWQWSRTGKFPAPRFIGSRTVWIADEVDEWMRTRPTRNYKTLGAREQA
jgi:predicted DNA-binding transcriptional regulator AlpA